MARPLIFTFKKQNLPFLPLFTSFLIILLAIISIFSIISFLCASHGKKSHKKEPNSSSPSSCSPCSSSSSNEKKLLSKLNSSISSKALLMVKMISWKKSNDHDCNEDYEDESEEAIWRKTIIMGEKCRHLDFSGKIEYDSRGNLISESCRF